MLKIYTEKSGLRVKNKIDCTFQYKLKKINLICLSRDVSHYGSNVLVISYENF